MVSNIQASDFIIISKGESLFIAAEGLCYEVPNPLLTRLQVNSSLANRHLYNGFQDQFDGFYMDRNEHEINISFISDDLKTTEGISLDSLKEDILGQNIEEEIEKLENKTVYELLKLVNKKINER